MNYKEAHSILGLDKRDYKILNLLSDGEKTSLDISSKLSIPRSTVLFKLNKLKKRNLVSKSGRRPYVFWRQVKKSFLTRDEIKKTTRTIEHKGPESVKNIWIHIIENLEGKLYFLETKHLAKNINLKFSEDFLKRCRKSIIQKKVIQEGVTPISAVTKKSKVSHIDKDKMMSWTIVPDEELDYHDSFIVRSGVVFMINLDRDLIIEIRNETLSKIMIEKIKKVAKTGKKVSFAKMVEQES